MAGENLESGGGGGGGEKGTGRSSSHSPSTYVIDTETHWTSWLVPLFVVANIALFVLAMYINDCPKHHRNDRSGKCVVRVFGRLSFEPLQENPLFGPSSSTLKKLGALEYSKLVHEHQSWRLITCIWLHAGLIHLLANMLSLVFVGIRLENQFGFVRIGIIYLLSGFSGSVLSSLFLQNSISVGASGALFGLLGAMLSELITNWTIYSNKAAALLTLLVIVVINLGIGVLPHIDNFAHIGGFLMGFLLGFVLLPRPRYNWSDIPTGAHVKSIYKAYQYVLWIISLVLLIVGFTVALVMLFRGVKGSDHCHWCRYLSCVPTSRWSCD